MLVPVDLLAPLSALSLTSNGPFLGFLAFIFLAAAGMSVQECSGGEAGVTCRRTAALNI